MSIFLKKIRSFLLLTSIITILFMIISAYPSESQNEEKGESSGLKVTILLYSGRPDPTYLLENKELIDKVSNLIKKKAEINTEAEKNTVIPSFLGYKGIFVYNQGNIPGLPTNIAIYKDKIELINEYKQFLMDEDRELENLFLTQALEKGIINERELGLIMGFNSKKARFTFFYKEGITEKDRLSIVGYLEPKLELMPFNKDVIVTIEASDPRNSNHMLKLFTQTIPKNIVSGTKKYRFRSGDSGTQELLFDQRSNSTYFYVNVDDIDFLPSVRASITPAQYLAFINDIKDYTVTIVIDIDIWSGSAPLKVGKRTSQKQELNFSR